MNKNTIETIIFFGSLALSVLKFISDAIGDSDNTKLQ